MLFKEFLAALESRGRKAEADKYRKEFLELFCPPMMDEEVLSLPFEDVCAASKLMLQMLDDLMTKEARVSTPESIVFSVTPGEHYLRKKGLLRD